MKGLAAIFAAKPKGPASEEDAEPAGEDEASEDPKQEYGDELASLLGVADADKQDFLDALHGYVMSCSGGEE